MIEEFCTCGHEKEVGHFWGLGECIWDDGCKEYHYSVLVTEVANRWTLGRFLKKIWTKISAKWLFLLLRWYDWRDG